MRNHKLGSVAYFIANGEMDTTALSVSAWRLRGNIYEGLKYENTRSDSSGKINANCNEAKGNP